MAPSVSAMPRASIPAPVTGAVVPPQGMESIVCGTPSLTYSMKMSAMFSSKHSGERTSA